jgi:hypothetical protein
MTGWELVTRVMRPMTDGKIPDRNEYGSFKHFCALPIGRPGMRSGRECRVGIVTAIGSFAFVLPMQ